MAKSKMHLTDQPKVLPCCLGLHRIRSVKAAFMRQMVEIWLDFSDVRSPACALEVGQQ